MWELLQRIKDKVLDPWVVMGDFNEALWQFEHFSNTKRGECQMEDFRAMLEVCDLYDLGFAGLPWTFDNKRVGHGNVKVRLTELSLHLHGLHVLTTRQFNTLSPGARITTQFS